MAEDTNRLFPLEIFPPVIQDMILHNKEIQNFDVNLQAGAYLSAIASSIGTNVKLHNGKFHSFPALWLVLVGNPGSKKTHVLKYPFKALEEEDHLSNTSYRERLKQWERENKNERGEEPEAKMTILKNFTLEALIQNHRRNPKGLVLKLDELAGWLKDFNKYNKGGGERDQYLDLFNCPSLKVDRVSSEMQYVSHTCVNIIGGIQPKRIDLIFKSGLEDGFAHRWLYCTLAKAEPNLWKEGELNERIVSKAHNFMSEINNLLPVDLTLSKSADSLYANWHNQRNLELMYNDSEMMWQTKMETYIFRFCIVLEIMDQVANKRSGTIVSAEIMEKALKLETFFTNQRKFLLGSQNLEVLEEESEEFQKAYRELGLKPYKKKELDDHFRRYLTEDNKPSDRTLANKYNGPLFTKQGYGLYSKAVINV